MYVTLTLTGSVTCHVHVAITCSSQEDGSKTFLCVHRTSDVIGGRLTPVRQLQTQRRAPVVVDAKNHHVIVGMETFST